MRKRLTQKQDRFALFLFEGLSQREAWIKAGYSSKYAPAIIDSNACRMEKTTKIQARLAELRAEVKSAAIMEFEERQRVLTEIARANMTNFVEVGQDGVWFNIDEKNLNSRAIQSVQSKTMLGKDGAGDAVFIRVNLHDPMRAIDLLNKMDKIYSEGSTVNVDNRKIEIIVNSEKAKDLTERIIAGERTLLEN